MNHNQNWNFSTETAVWWPNCTKVPSLIIINRQWHTLGWTTCGSGESEHGEHGSKIMIILIFITTKIEQVYWPDGWVDCTVVEDIIVEPKCSNLHKFIINYRYKRLNDPTFNSEAHV